MRALNGAGKEGVLHHGDAGQVLTYCVLQRCREARHAPPAPARAPLAPDDRRGRPPTASAVQRPVRLTSSRSNRSRGALVARVCRRVSSPAAGHPCGSAGTPGGLKLEWRLWGSGDAPNCPWLNEFFAAVVPTFLNVVARMGLCVVNRFASFGPLSRSAPSARSQKTTQTGNDRHCTGSTLGSGRKGWVDLTHALVQIHLYQGEILKYKSDDRN